jgi:hypothetical protein
LDFSEVLIAGGWLTEAEALDRRNLETVAAKLLCDWTAAKKNRSL